MEKISQYIGLRWVKGRYLQETGWLVPPIVEVSWGFQIWFSRVVPSILGIWLSYNASPSMMTSEGYIIWIHTHTYIYIYIYIHNIRLYLYNIVSWLVARFAIVPKKTKLFWTYALFGRFTIVARNLGGVNFFRPKNVSVKKYEHLFWSNLAFLPVPKESDRLLNPY